MKLRYRILRALEDAWLWFGEKFWNFIFKALPAGQVSDPESCKHTWYVDSYDYEHIAINVMRFGCSSNGLVKNPTEEEWLDAFGKNMKKYIGQSEVTWLFQWDE